jgi:mannose-1-phosphate guanylyltransferase
MRNTLAALELDVRIRFAEEPDARGTAGAIRFAEDMLADRFLVLNGDILCDLDLTAQIAQHESTGARATIALYPVEDPTGYGLVHRHEDGEITEFLEKPEPDQIDTDEINAGAYLLERSVLDQIPPERAVSIEREVFPRLIGEGLYGIRLDGYWIDIGTPDKYTQVHRDIMDGRFSAAPFADLAEPRVSVAADARIEAGARVEGPCFIDEGVLVKPGARIGPYSVVGRQTQVDENASIENAIIWPNCRIGDHASVQNAVLGRNCHVGRSVSVNGGAVLGDKTTLTDYSRA